MTITIRKEVKGIREEKRNMGFFIGLPSHWVLVHYENGEVRNVANTDYFTREEALEYKRNWEKPGNKIVKVTLVDNDKKVVDWFNFS